MKKKLLMLTVAIIAVLLASSFTAISLADVKPKPEYVPYVLKIAILPTGHVVTYTDSSNFPVVITDGYVPDTCIVPVLTNVTINGVVYTFPKDFDYNYTFHSELNEVTGMGLEMIQETLCFNHLPGHPTLLGRAEEKDTSLILYPTPNLSNAEVIGNFQLTGTGKFSNVEGSGTGMFGVSTGFVVYHFALIKGWSLDTDER